MKTVKPLRLSVITRPFLRAGEQRLAVTTMCMVSMVPMVPMVSMGQPHLLTPEPEFWKTLSDELGPATAIDMGLPKARAEVLATGFAYTAHQQEKTMCGVRLQLGGLSKDLAVFGDRYWVGGRPTPPQPFEAMRVDWTRAYGGPSFADNPLGRGHEREPVDGREVQRLPNVEHPSRRVHRPDEQPEPASFGPLDIAWPRRLRLIGKQYDEHWRTQLFPGFAQDMDWQLFNAAPPDQRLPDAMEIAPGTPYAVWNMHPAIAVQQGRLPDWRALAFIARRGSPGHVEKVAQRLTTAWFFPHLERIALVFHGETTIEEDDASDITHVMPALETADAPRGLAHYANVLRQRCDPEKGALYMFRDDELVPATAIGPWLDQPEQGAQAESALVRNMRERGAQARDELKQMALDAGHKARHFRERPLPAPFQRLPTLHELPEFVEQADAYARAQRAQGAIERERLQREADANAKESRKVGFDTGKLVREHDRTEVKGPPRVDGASVLSGFTGIAAATGTAPAPAAQVESMRRMAEAGERGLLALYRGTAQHQATVVPLAAERLAALRAQVTSVLEGDRDFTGMDLTAADLSGMDLRGACFRRALLESADLRGARCDSADFSEAVLVRAQLSGASFQRAVLRETNLAGIDCKQADFSHADLEGAKLEKVTLKACSFEGARLHQLHVLDSRLQGCDFGSADIAYVGFLSDASLEDCSFRGARLFKAAFLSCHVARLDFTGATLEACAFTHTACDDGMVFAQALLRTTCFAGNSSLRNASFEGATLVQCSLREISLEGARLARATLDTCDFSSCNLGAADLTDTLAPDSLFIRADLSRASLRGANLMTANFNKALLAGADLREANLFRADMSQIRIDTVTATQGAYIEQAKTVPALRTAPGR
ncbi:DUF2169 domain-containing protein [Variovorax sp. J22G73]|uniref:DUF2169 family type VI secretion system accessory protein n=1 Tax=unclassified Variovorax TaxID=663243 RepID=UPI000D5F95B8|nr:MULTISPECIES: DUF2169 domain-containing protein [unclassified Variovorax]MDM0006702.1 DUF2169 domain-containing protein [Variovorax sp. J22R203]MDM0097274.1 DUF2169 domain-containing protein [Variovorax sp. J22G73]